MNYVNIGILAHVDAGKTSLTERLLFNAGIIRRIGRVDNGDTQTDSLDLERRRGITIQSAVVTFPMGRLQVNIIDTPGHSDFVAEVERALRVLDGAVLLVSAVEGVQARTRVLMRSLERLSLPALIFVNKIDRKGARSTELLRDMRAMLGNACVPMTEVANLGTPNARTSLSDLSSSGVAEDLTEILADNDDRLLEKVVGSEEQPGPSELWRELQRQTHMGWVRPVYFGSALTGEGVDMLATGIAKFLHRKPPSKQSLRADVFKVERGRAGEKCAYVRVFDGVIRPRDRVTYFRDSSTGEAKEFSERVSAVRVFHRGTQVRESTAESGSIAKIWGLTGIQIGDQLGARRSPSSGSLFEPPTLETFVAAREPRHRHALFEALQRIAERDPLINVQREEATDAISLRLYGEVQKEVIGATLLEEFGIDAAFEESRTICVERPVGTGEALEQIMRRDRNFFWATVGLRISPNVAAEGVSFQVAVRLGELPLSFHKAIRESVQATLQRGLFGWQVVNCEVTLVKTGYASPVSAAGDFRSATPLVVAEALKRAKTEVLEPVHRFSLEVPECTAGAVGLALSKLDGIADDESTETLDAIQLTGTLPARNVHRFTKSLPELSQGRGILHTEFSGYQAFRGPPPRRPHRGANPYDREQYMLHALGRV